MTNVTSSPVPTREADQLCEALVARLVAYGDIRSTRVRAAMLAVPRHRFVPYAPLDLAYANHPLPIGFGQTISQPTIVARMTEALELAGDERVLEIGTGSGYQTAILSKLAAEVLSIEVVAELATEARTRLAELGYTNVRVRHGDGYAGWRDEAPFDRIVVTAAPPMLPVALIDQLGDRGVLVAPIGRAGRIQTLFRVRRAGDELYAEELGEVRFVPMEHEAPS
jgi:protein-L-isoaspartate(D-aspartate) O-methyltransferase